jgi:hypothetical protein
MTPTHSISLVVLVCFVGCARTGGRKATCEWPQEAVVLLDLSKPSDLQHLSDDALVAEDLAIRYADSDIDSTGRRARGEDYVRTRSKCMVKLFEAIGKNHGVTLEEVRHSLRHRRTTVDLAVILSFALLFSFAASLVARRICRLHPLEDGWVGPIAMTAFVSIAGGVCGVLLGEQWSLTLEMLRIGNGHISYRVERIPWTQHRLGFFAGCVILFWLMVGLRYYRTGVRGNWPRVH